MIELSNTIHGYARPDTKERLLDFYTNVLGLKPTTTPPPYWTGSPDEFYGFGFPDGKVMSGEFTENALDEAQDDRQARRGLWLMLRTDDADALQQKVLDFGLRRIVHPYTDFFYVQAPGGQVFRIVSTK
jgi:catechol 2,3-dioxygenase-like lactoylglutathione lyase family enzyme